MAQDSHNERVAGFMEKLEEKLSVQKWPIRAMDGGRRNKALDWQMTTVGTQRATTPGR